MNRYRLYQSRERRWAAITLLCCTLAVCAAGATIVFAILQMPWLAIGSCVAVPLLWAAWCNSLAACSYWCQRKTQEAYRLNLK